jgi:hypothetical protein
MLFKPLPESFSAFEPSQELMQVVAVATPGGLARDRRVEVGPENRRSNDRLSSDRRAVLYAMPPPALVDLPQF